MLSHPVSFCETIKLITLGTVLFLALAAPVKAARVKDLASVQGVRGNQLVGYGLVVGLAGTGDGNKSPFTTQALANMLKNVGMVVNEADLKVKNVAGVMVTATLPPFVKPGQSIDVTISSLGDATSLQGGTLVATPLKGLDDQVYALAQGAISIGGLKSAGPTGAAPAGGQENHPTVARIPEGATVEKKVPMPFGDQRELTLSLNSPDFTTVNRLTKAIDAALGGKFARAEDGATVKVVVPSQYRQNEVALMAKLEDIDVTPDSVARVVVDERTGTIVMGDNVRIGELALSHGNLSIQVTADPTQPPGKELLGKELTEDRLRKLNEAWAAQNGGKTNNLIKLSPGVTLAELVRALNSVGAAPKDLIAIFQAIKAAGAMQAELTII